MLPDVLTEGDNLEMPPMPDASFLLSQMDEGTSNLNRRRRANSRDINLQEDFNNSQFLQQSIEKRDYLDEDLALDGDDIDLGLDLGLDLDEDMDRSVEIGRHAPEPRPVEDDIFSQSELNLAAKDNYPIGEGREVSPVVGIADEDDFRPLDDDGDVPMGGDLTFNMGDQPDAPSMLGAPAPPLDRERISESPLSDIDPNFAREIEEEHERNNDTTIFQPEEETEESIFRNPAQRARRVKPLTVDQDTMIPNNVIKAQQQDHSKILRPQSFLPRDPNLMALMEMQRNGGFVSDIMGDGRSAGWAPELRGMLSLDAIKRSGELKRKRDSGVADLEEQAAALKSPRLEIEEEEDVVVLPEAGEGRADTTIAADGTIIELPEESFAIPQMEDEGLGGSRPGSQPGSRPVSRDEVTPPPDFDDTTMPLVHPADSGPVSLGTQHAVHLLRDRFGSDAADSPGARRNASVLFQDLLPEATTSRADATKMFFEVLVLATKDAVKVDQNDSTIGAPIRVRGKRGLWGSWAEREAGGEIATEEGVAPSAGPAMVSAEA